MSTALSSFSGTALRGAVTFAALVSVAAAAPFQAGLVRLNLADSDGSSLARQLDGSVRMDAAAAGGRAIYSVRLKAAPTLLERCESGTLYLDYMAVPAYVDRRTGELVHPKTMLFIDILRDASGAGAEQVQVPFTFDAAGRFEMRDTLRPNACFMPDANTVVNCGIRWSTAARVACD